MRRRATLSLCCSVLLLVGATACSSGSHHKGSPSPTTFGPVDAPQSLSAARAKYEQVLKHDPHDKYAWYNLAVIAADECDPASAATDLLKALDIDPHFEAARYLY